MLLLMSEIGDVTVAVKIMTSGHRIFVEKRDRELGESKDSSHQADMQHDLLRSLRDLDLACVMRSNFKIDWDTAI